MRLSHKVHELLRAYENPEEEEDAVVEFLQDSALWTQIRLVCDRQFEELKGRKNYIKSFPPLALLITWNLFHWIDLAIFITMLLAA